MISFGWQTAAATFGFGYTIHTGLGLQQGTELLHEAHRLYVDSSIALILDSCEASAELFIERTLMIALQGRSNEMVK